MDDAQGLAREPFFRTTDRDGRADRGRREIAISGTAVTICRRVSGVDMRLSLAVSAYRGVALCLRPGGGETLVYQIRLVHQDSELSVLLDEAADDSDIIADWRLWARVLGRPALVERHLGIYEPVPGSSSGSALARATGRRKRPLKRRPRFLSRRRVGRWPATPDVHANEREIIART